jgi:hypothetical protein
MKNNEKEFNLVRGAKVMKLSFKVQLSIMLITITAVVFAIVYFVDKTKKQAEFSQIRAQQAADKGFEEAMFVAMGDTIQKISGKTEEGGEFSVEIVKDTISVDSIEIKINARGEFANEVRSTSKRILLVSPDSINWVLAD